MNSSSSRSSLCSIRKSRSSAMAGARTYGPGPTRGQSGKMNPCKPTPGRTVSCTNRTSADGAEPSLPIRGLGRGALGRPLVGRGMRHRRPLRDDPGPRRTEPGPGHRSVRRIREVRPTAPGGPPVRCAGGRRSILPFDNASFDAVVSGLMLNFIADQGGVAKELVRVAAPGATIAIYVWDYAGGMQMMRYFWDAAKDMDASARAGRGRAVQGARIVEGTRRPVRPGGAQRRAVTLDRHPHDLPGLRRLLDTVPERQGPAPAYCASLDEGKRAELRELLKVRLPTKADGTIRLTARAWAVQGRPTDDYVPDLAPTSVYEFHGSRTGPPFQVSRYGTPSSPPVRRRRKLIGNLGRTGDERGHPDAGWTAKMSRSATEAVVASWPSPCPCCCPGS